MNKQSGRRRRPGVEQQRRIILDAAVTLFSARGSSSVSVSEICQRAAVSRDTFYRSFSDKDALIRHLYDTAVNDHMLAVVSASDLDYSDQRWLHRAMDQTIDSILAHAPVAQFLYVESANPDTLAYQLVNSAYDKVARRMQRWCKAHYQSAPPLEYFKALLSATQWLVHNAIIKGMTRREIDKAKRAAEDLYLRAFTPLGD